MIHRSGLQSHQMTGRPCVRLAFLDVRAAGPAVPWGSETWALGTYVMNSFVDEFCADSRCPTLLQLLVAAGGCCWCTQ